MAVFVSEPVKVLIVDDSASARAMLRCIVESDPALVVIGAAADAFSAVKLMKLELPDVILLDLELPGMDGTTFLKRIMAQRPIPVVVCSGMGAGGSEQTLAALEAGAVDVILKPNARDERARAEAQVRICDALRAASQSRGARHVSASAVRAPGTKLSPDEVLPPPNPSRPVPVTEPIVVIGASTGGTEALRQILVALPPDAPAIAIVQHMPPGFTAAFARRMDGLCQIRVTEAVDGVMMRKGEAVIAPGDYHMILRRLSSGYRVSITDGPQVSRHRPSVDVLFRSAATAAGRNALGIILTGMGDDGALCLGEMKASGALTVAQDEASSVVYGMPREAVRIGSALQSLSLDRMAAAIMGFARRHNSGVQA
ncbi:protein-glutamate methylesterase/protein-glutamine glutaminase [Pseudotabrizicola algicola]|uniref:Protein-glutamate methylesterase/protein-glutamine glutaminase n=1 Tax=Pseudotabrizicola algicola TaxID=2709381 RepID=A0A6B3RJG5_9RHOB|nr:chemotaxis response regulator protein-glutamate methylesterase [Pseudotabrizicola algicola]NEX46160.1 chemotaxis response regulator protein-glutamate methylesterase [Pseudotabrizicola algicola]